MVSCYASGSPGQELRAAALPGLTGQHPMQVLLIRIGFHDSLLQKLSTVMPVKEVSQSGVAGVPSWQSNWRPPRFLHAKVTVAVSA